jgi:hypothetical protein
LLVNLISFLHSDSPFSWKKNFPEATTPWGVRVATFYELPGNFQQDDAERGYQSTTARHGLSPLPKTSTDYVVGHSIIVCRVAQRPA